MPTDGGSSPTTAEGTSQVLEVVEWNSMVEIVRENSNAIKELQTLPAALSEIKGLLGQMMTGSDGVISAAEDDDDDEIRSGDGSTDLDDAVKSLLSKTSQPSNQSEASHSVQQILDQTQAEPEYGPNLRNDVALSFGRFIQKKSSKETTDKWKENYKAPDNCRTLGVPRVNHEIWAVLPNKARQSDVQWQSIQTNVSMTSVALSRMAEKVVSDGNELPGKWQEQLLQMILECASINNLTNQSLISQRKKDMRPFVSTEASVICSANNVTTDLLFGSDFQEEIKASKSALNAVKAKPLKPTFPFKKDNRFMPYRKPSGNLSAPPSRSGVRGGFKPRRYDRRPFSPQQPPRNQGMFPHHSQDK